MASSTALSFSVVTLAILYHGWYDPINENTIGNLCFLLLESTRVYADAEKATFLYL
jgi:hypothetical protein